LKALDETRKDGCLYMANTEIRRLHYGLSLQVADGKVG
jgi:hypothetical protein